MPQLWSSASLFASRPRSVLSWAAPRTSRRLCSHHHGGYTAEELAQGGKVIGGYPYFHAGGFSAPDHGRPGGHGIRSLIKKYGLPLAVYYVLLTEALTVAITYLLYYNYLGTGDITSVLKFFGLGRMVDVDAAMETSRTIGPFTVSGRLLTNFAMAKSFIALFAPLKLTFCITTLPGLMRLLGRKMPHVKDKVKDKVKHAAQHIDKKKHGATASATAAAGSE